MGNESENQRLRSFMLKARNSCATIRIIQYEVTAMAVSYKKLWKLLIDRNMKKKDLCAAAGISHTSMAKLGKNENVTTDVLVKICTALQCDISDIMEVCIDVTDTGREELQ